MVFCQEVGSGVGDILIREVSLGLPAARVHDPPPAAKTSSPRFPKHGRVPIAVSFLFPLYLLGVAAIAGPILLHLRRRPPKEHMEFSSLMFLAKSPERVTRRTRLEHLLQFLTFPF